QHRPAYMDECLDAGNDAPSGQIEQRVDDVAPLEADAPVAHDVEQPSLEAVAAAYGVHLAGQVQLPDRRLLDRHRAADVRVHVADVDRSDGWLDVVALDQQVS